MIILNAKELLANISKIEKIMKEVELCKKKEEKQKDK